MAEKRCHVNRNSAIGGACGIGGAVLQTPAMNRASKPAFSFALQGVRRRARFADEPAGSATAYWYRRFS
jgi:hypothetical protein